MSNVIWGLDATATTEFNAAFWAHQPTAVQALQNLGPGSAERVALAQRLAGEGYTINVPIMAWGEDVYAWFVMWWNQGVGSVSCVPGGSLTIPNMGLPIAQLVALYPPFTPPTPPAQPSTNPVLGDLGVQINGHEAFECAATDPHPVGFPYQGADGHVYIKTQLNGGAAMAGMESQPYCVWLQW